MTPLPSFQVPRPLKLGDSVHVVAPAGPFDRTLFWKGVGWISQHFRVHWSPSIFERDGFVAGCRTHRVNDLMAALTCGDCRALLCARGGVGSAEVAALLPPGALTHHLKWLVGFSDITALHCAYQRAGLMSIHAPNVASLGLGDANVRDAWLQGLLNPLLPQEHPVDVLVAGSARGPLVGGNLAVLHDLCAGDEWMPPRGAILFIEEIGEAPYRIHRMLAALARRGIPKLLAGIVVGQITASHPGRHGTTAKQVCRQFCREHQLPAGWGVPSGHEPNQNLPLTLGAQASLQLPETGVGSLQLNYSDAR